MKFGWVVLAVCALVCLGSGQQTSTCRLNQGQMPADGACAGPMERIQLKRANFNLTQSGCALTAVKYWVENVQSRPPRVCVLFRTLKHQNLLAPHRNQCGECVPGTAGVDDPLRACRINEYCSDEGRCVSLSQHPLMGAPCPFEQGISSMVLLSFCRPTHNPFAIGGPSALGWCGPGLRCINHACVACMEGVTDPTDGKMCVLGQWYNSPCMRCFCSLTETQDVFAVGHGVLRSSRHGSSVPYLLHPCPTHRSFRRYVSSRWFLMLTSSKTVWLRAWVVQRREDETDDGTTLAALAPDAVSLRDMSGTGRSGRRRSQSEDSNPFEDELSDDEPTASASDSGAGVRATRRR
jgi:hypothetical protein